MTSPWMTISWPPLSFSLTDDEAANFFPKTLAASLSLRAKVSSRATLVTALFLFRTSFEMMTFCLSALMVGLLDDAAAALALLADVAGLVLALEQVGAVLGDPGARLVVVGVVLAVLRRAGRSRADVERPCPRRSDSLRVFIASALSLPSLFTRAIPDAVDRGGPGFTPSRAATRRI